MLPRTRSDFLQYGRKLSLDLNTVNTHLRLSEGNAVIRGTLTEQPYLDHPDRFEGSNLQALCTEQVCGRCYWELEWSGLFGVELSVSYRSIGRKGQGLNSVFGLNHQSWSLSCSPLGFTFRHNDTETALPVMSGRRIGVFVDHSAGSLSFYSVCGDSMSLIHSVQTSFTQPLCPGLYVFIGSSVRLCVLGE